MDVRINATKVSSRRTSEGLFLFHAPSARVVTLDKGGEMLWKRLEEGTNDLSQLVAEYQREAEVTPEEAAFQVLNFLEVLQAEDFVSYTRPIGSSGPPLLDVALDGTNALEFVSDSDLDEMPEAVEAFARGNVVRLRAARANLDLRNLRDMAANEIGGDIGEIRRVKVLDLEPGEVSGPLIRQVATSKLSPVSTQERRLVDIVDPNADLTVKDLAEKQRSSGSIAAKRSSSALIVIIIFFPDTIVIVVIDDGGPTFGKSRNSCKTVCV